MIYYVYSGYNNGIVLETESLIQFLFYIRKYIGTSTGTNIASNENELEVNRAVFRTIYNEWHLQTHYRYLCFDSCGYIYSKSKILELLETNYTEILNFPWPKKKRYNYEKFIQSMNFLVVRNPILKYSWFRNPKTIQENRCNCRDFRYTRGKRRNLPDSYSDIRIKTQKSWKQIKKRKQYE